MNDDTHWFVCELSCPLCRGQVEYVSKSAPDPYHAAFVVNCPKCSREMIVKIDLVLCHKPDPMECGSIAGYNRHLRRNESPCTPCTEARNTYERDRRDKRRREKRALVNA